MIYYLKEMTKNIKQVNICILGILSSEEINKIIENQQNLNKKKNHTEYKIINSDEEEHNSKTFEECKEIHDISKELNQNTCIDIDDNEDEHLDSDKINDLKNSILHEDI